MKLRFSLRDLLWLTALVAVAVAWWLDSRQSAEQIDVLQADQITSRTHFGTWQRKRLAWELRINQVNEHLLKEVRRLKPYAPVPDDKDLLLDGRIRNSP